MPESSVRLHVTTVKAEIPPHLSLVDETTDLCGDPMTCECSYHVRERKVLKRRGVRSSGHQPWQSRPSRRSQIAA